MDASIELFGNHGENYSKSLTLPPIAFQA
jgi:hypothetical protein